MERAALVLEAKPMTAGAAVADLARRVARRGFAVAADIVGAADAEDMVQESLVRVIQHRGRDLDNPEAWFFRVLVRLCLRHLRRRRVVGLLRGVLGLAEDPVAAAVVDPAPAADDELARRGALRRTLATLGALPDRQRTALLLRYGHGLPVAEVAAMLGVGEGTVKTHLVRGLARLREAEELSR
jgi:RNA polymerase sigma factor (sigma-70 family)